MAAHRKTDTSKRASRSTATAAVPLGERVRGWLLFALVALVVARPLLPSEGVAWIGDGQPFNLLTLCLAVSWLALAVIEGGFARRMNLADAAVAALVVLCVAAALVGAQNDSPRHSINMLFEWVSLGLIFFLTRQLVRTSAETRMLVAIMVALAATMAAYGYYQVFVGLPSTRAAYAENPDEALRALGQWFPPDSPERRQFENRLQSSEPFATFALTNSLAGFLAPWFVIAMAILLDSIGMPSVSDARGAAAPRRMPAASLAGMVVLLVALAGCLVLTKSRSAYVAVASGAVLLPLVDRGIRERLLARRIMLAGGALVCVLIVVAVAVKGLDIQVLTEARKSLGFRLEYWRSTLAMIGHYPWLGVGPGNFQDYYTQFKLPEASEEIRDPHNFLLEVWATAGTFALVALGEVLAVLAWRTWKSTGAGQSEARPVGPPATPHFALMAAGAVTGFFLAFLVGPSVGLVFGEQQLLGGLLAAVAALALLWPWAARGTLPARVPALGVLVLAIHLLAAGGIAYPGVAGTFWMLVALGLNETDPLPVVAARQALPRRLGRAPAVALALAGAAGLACYYFAYRPVVRSHTAMMRSADERESTDTRINQLVDAAEADPLSAEPWWAIAELELARLKEKPTESKWSERFVTAIHRVLELRPHSSTAWRQAGRWSYEFYRYDRHPDTAKAAAKALERAVDLYPNLPELHAEYALALSATGDTVAAQRELEIARRLDALTPHADKQLSPQMREQLDRLEDTLR